MVHEVQTYGIPMSYVKMGPIKDLYARNIRIARIKFNYSTKHGLIIIGFGSHAP